MPAFKILFVAMKAQQGWRKIPPEHRRAIVRAAQGSARKHGPQVARTVKERGPTAARRLAEILRESRKKP